MTSNANFDITGVWPNGGALSSPAFWTALKFGLPRRGVSLRRSTGAVAFPSCRPARHLGLRFRTGFSVCRTFMRLGRFAPRRIPAVWGVAGGVSSQIDRSLPAFRRFCPTVGGGVRPGAGAGDCDKPKISCRIADFADAPSVVASPEGWSTGRDRAEGRRLVRRSGCAGRLSCVRLRPAAALTRHIRTRLQLAARIRPRLARRTRVQVPAPDRGPRPGSAPCARPRLTACRRTRPHPSAP